MEKYSGFIENSYKKFGKKIKNLTIFSKNPSTLNPPVLRNVSISVLLTISAMTLMVLLTIFWLIKNQITPLKSLILKPFIRFYLP